MWTISVTMHLLSILRPTRRFCLVPLDRALCFTRKTVMVCAVEFERAYCPHDVCSQLLVECFILGNRITMNACSH
eukprot:m.706317 g.706317  ORF g.706317 m.706317 type:complete len:75 (+) comp22931_c0_seq34:1307-1531(+)